MSEPTCTAADGKTVVYSIPGYPLMVRAVDFNALFGSTHHAAPGAPQQEAPRVSASRPVLYSDEYDSRAAATAPAGGVTEGPGSPAMRFKLLMRELDNRFPDPTPFSGELPELRLLARIDAALTTAARAAEPEGEIEAYAMRMSWNDQSPDDQAHYLKVAKAATSQGEGTS